MWDDHPSGHWWLLQETVPPILTPWSPHRLREAVLRANTALRAEPFEEGTLTQIRSLPPREWSDSITPPSEAGPDVELRMLDAIRQFLATAGHRSVLFVPTAPATHTPHSDSARGAAPVVLGAQLLVRQLRVTVPQPTPT